MEIFRKKHQFHCYTRDTFDDSHVDYANDDFGFDFEDNW
jgi:hypothetical protein